MKTISAHSKSTVYILRLKKNIHLRGHCPFNVLRIFFFSFCRVRRTVGRRRRWKYRVDSLKLFKKVRNYCLLEICRLILEFEFRCSSGFSWTFEGSYDSCWLLFCWKSRQYWCNSSWLFVWRAISSSWWLLVVKEANPKKKYWNYPYSKNRQIGFLRLFQYK